MTPLDSPNYSSSLDCLAGFQTAPNDGRHPGLHVFFEGLLSECFVNIFSLFIVIEG